MVSDPFDSALDLRGRRGRRDFASFDVYSDAYRGVSGEDFYAYDVDDRRRFAREGTACDRGHGYIDMHLLTATALHGNARLWTLDRRFRDVAAELHLGYEL